MSNTQRLKLTGSDRLTLKEGESLLEFLHTVLEKHTPHEILLNRQSDISAFYRAHNKIYKAVEEKKDNDNAKT